MLKLGRVTKVKVFFVMLVYVFDIDLLGSIKSPESLNCPKYFQHSIYFSEVVPKL